jgi:hypothetical protein
MVIVTFCRSATVLFSELILYFGGIAEWYKFGGSSSMKSEDKYHIYTTARYFINTSITLTKTLQDIPNKHTALLEKNLKDILDTIKQVGKASKQSEKV